MSIDKKWFITHTPVKCGECGKLYTHKKHKWPVTDPCPCKEEKKLLDIMLNNIIEKLRLQVLSVFNPAISKPKTEIKETMTEKEVGAYLKKFNK